MPRYYRRRRRRFASRPYRRMYRRRNYRRNNVISTLSRVGMKPELNGNNFQLDDTSISSSGSITSIGAVAQGDSRITRTGDLIRLRSIYGRLFFTINGSATNTQIRHLIIIDKTPDGTAPTLTELLDNPTVPLSLVSPINFNQTQRFRIIRDKLYTLNDVNTTTLAVKYFRRLNMTVSFNGGTATPIRNQLFEIFISSEATNTPTVSSTGRFRFYG